MNAVPAQLRNANRRAILDRLLRKDGATRSQLAAELGMSAPTAGKVIAELLGAGVLEEADADGGGAGGEGAPVLGRPGRVLRLERATPRFVLVQLGVRHTRVTAAALGDLHRSEASWDAEFETGGDAEAWRKSLAGTLRELRLPRPRSVVVSVPGLVDEAAGRVVFSPNLHWTEPVSLAALVQSAWAVPVCLVQEVRALALGHHLAEGERDFFLCDVGDGVGGAAVVDGRLMESVLPLVGEIGHTPVVGNARRCGCGGVGCLETLVSRGAILRAKREHAGGATWAQVVARMERRGVEPWLAELLDAAGVGIAGALNVLGLRHVVVTGAVTEWGEMAVRYLEEKVRGAAMWGRFGEVRCEAAPRRRALGLIAAGVQRMISPVSERERLSVCRPEGHRTERVRRRGVLA